MNKLLLVIVTCMGFNSFSTLLKASALSKAALVAEEERKLAEKNQISTRAAALDPEDEGRRLRARAAERRKQANAVKTVKDEEQRVDLAKANVVLDKKTEEALKKTKIGDMPFRPWELIAQHFNRADRAQLAKKVKKVQEVIDLERTHLTLYGGPKKDLEGLKGLLQRRAFATTSINAYSFTDEGLKIIADVCPKLRSLDVYYGTITDAGLKYLTGLRNLQTLNLSNCSNITGAGLMQLAGLTNLETLDLSRCNKITDAGLKYLEGLTNLKTLNLSECHQITDVGLKYLADLTSLETLNLSCSKITSIGLKYFEGLTKLKSLNLSFCDITDAGLMHLTGLTNLQTLNLYYCKQLTDAGLKYLAGLTNLRSLVLPSHPYPFNMYIFTNAAIKKLQSVLPSCRITSEQ